ncbi:hypothetical protein [Streptomyces sp. CEV 2-1]|uniref:hypothetical protein n=1 Tax=Streptomyces sp. CEV 2-1 TaxID=2485153 RepID=UPI0011CD36A4|nr:hypothetical protein [Streptomyces sp. CEV 2-1]
MEQIADEVTSGYAQLPVIFHFPPPSLKQVTTALCWRVAVFAPVHLTFPVIPELLAQVLQLSAAEAVVMVAGAESRHAARAEINMLRRALGTMIPPVSTESGKRESG